MKITYNAIFTEVYEIQTIEGRNYLKQSLKNNVINDNFIRTNFLAGARFLQTISDTSFLTIHEIIDNEDEASIVSINDGFMQLGIFLLTKNSISDYEMLKIVKKILFCIGTLHDYGLFHQGLNPNSFVINDKGEIKLSFFGILEHRLYDKFPIVNEENFAIQNAIRFYSPERNSNFGEINALSEYYSIGMIIWFIKCIQMKLINPSQSLLKFPDYHNTGSSWDLVIESCLKEDPVKRPKSILAILSLLPNLEELNEFTPTEFNTVMGNTNTPKSLSKKTNGNKILVFLFIVISLGLVLFFTAQHFINDLIIVSTQNVVSEPDVSSPEDTKVTEPKNDAAENDSPSEYPFSKAEIIDFIHSYYQSLNNQNMEGIEDFLAPVLEKYYIKSNIDRDEVKRLGEEWFNKYQQYTEIYEDRIEISKHSNYATIIVPINLKKINKMNDQVSYYEIEHHITLSEDLKIKKLTEKITKNY